MVDRRRVGDGKVEAEKLLSRIQCFPPLSFASVQLRLCGWPRGIELKCRDCIRKNGKFNIWILLTGLGAAFSLHGLLLLHK